jgi:hypothetical protein
MKVGCFEVGGRRRLGAFENEWAIDLNAAYGLLLIDKGVSQPEAKANFELPNDMVSFIEKQGISMPAAKETLDYVRKKNYNVLKSVSPKLLLDPPTNLPKLYALEPTTRIIGSSSVFHFHLFLSSF